MKIAEIVKLRDVEVLDYAMVKKKRGRKSLRTNYRLGRFRDWTQDKKISEITALID